MTSHGQLPDDAVPDTPAARTLHDLLAQNELLRQAHAKLTNARNFYFDLYESAPVAYCTVNSLGLIEHANHSASVLLSVDRGALLKQTMASLILPEDRESYHLLCQRLAENGERQAGEIRMLRHGSSPFWALIQASLGADIDGAPMLRLALSDMTQREEAEEKSRSNEERLSLTVQASNVGLWDWDLRTNQVYFSPEWKRQLGHEDHEIAHAFAEWESRLHPDDLVPTLERVQAALADPAKARHEAEFRMRRKDGSWCWIRAQGRVFHDLSGKAVRMMGCHLDITDRKLLEDSQRKSEQRWRSIAENPFDFVVVIDRDYRYIYVNHTAPGISLDSLIGKATPFDFTHPDFHPVMRESFQKTFDTGSATSYEVYVEQLDTWYSSVVGPIIEHGTVTSLTILTREITAEKRAEAQQRRLQEQLHHAQKMESLGLLAGGVAHDMNNVLGAILGLASAHVNHHSPGSATHEAFDTICKAAIRGGTTVNGLLSLSRQIPAEDRIIDLNEILRDDIRLLERTTFSSVRLEISLASDLQPIRGDASSLSHALMNLCVNAVDAMSGSGVLTFITRNIDPEWIEAVVEDTGCGMTKEVLAKAIDPFFTTKELGKGTGLGLSLVYSTVTAHRGRMEIHSVPGHGTRVSLFFPTCSPISAPTITKTEAQPKPSARSMHVLLVDDDDLIQVMMESMLVTLGCRTTSATSGEDALAKLATGLRPDVVILDMNMPGLGGRETLARLRRHHATLPVLLSTGRVDQNALDLVSQHAHVSLLAKPFTILELQRHLNQHLA